MVEPATSLATVQQSKFLHRGAIGPEFVGNVGIQMAVLGRIALQLCAAGSLLALMCQAIKQVPRLDLRWTPC